MRMTSGTLMSKNVLKDYKSLKKISLGSVVARSVLKEISKISIIAIQGRQTKKQQI